MTHQRQETIMGKFYELSAEEVESAKKWIETLTRSVWHARVIHGDKQLKEADANRFVVFRKRWDEFANKVGPLSLWDRAQEENKKWLADLLDESHRIYDEYTAKGMVLIPMPGQTELVLLSKRIPQKITPKTAKEILSKALDWGKKVRNENTTWLETFRKALSFPVKPVWETDREKAMYPLYNAIEAGLKELLVWHEREPFWRWSKQPAYAAGSPEYEKWKHTIDMIFIEAAALIGVHEQIAQARAAAIDKATDVGGDILNWFVYAAYIAAGAGATYLVYSLVKGESPEKDKVDVSIQTRPGPSTERWQPSPHTA
jgi:hypothetical protein